MLRLLSAAALASLTTLAFVPRAHAVDIDALWSEFAKNEGAFKQKYQGKAISVTGPVWIINSEVTPASIALRAGASTGGYLGNVYCYTSKASALAVSKGATITVSGTFASAGPSGLNINACSVQ